MKWLKASNILILPRLFKIPKCLKGQGCKHALQMCRGSDKVWVETKYDGERTQIHVELVSTEGQLCRPKITIFSKSGRDSTLDRFGIHSWVLILKFALFLTQI